MDDGSFRLDETSIIKFQVSVVVFILCQRRIGYHEA